MLALEGVFMIPALIIAAVLHERASVVALAETIAICFLLGAGGTGGIGVLADSCASYTVAQQIKITAFMILFGISFSMYFLLLSGNLKAFFFD